MSTDLNGIPAVVFMLVGLCLMVDATLTNNLSLLYLACASYASAYLLKP